LVSDQILYDKYLQYQNDHQNDINNANQYLYEHVYADFIALSDATQLNQNYCDPRIQHEITLKLLATVPQDAIATTYHGRSSSFYNHNDDQNSSDNATNTPLSYVKNDERSSSQIFSSTPSTPMDPSQLQVSSSHSGADPNDTFSSNNQTIGLDLALDLDFLEAISSKPHDNSSSNVNTFEEFDLLFDVSTHNTDTHMKSTSSETKLSHRSLTKPTSLSNIFMMTSDRNSSEAAHQFLQSLPDFAYLM
jgi:hypothetical protein